MFVNEAPATAATGKYVVTNKRLMSSQGVLSKQVATIPLQRVTDLRYTQSPLGRMLNYGTFLLESANRRNAMRRIVHLPNPNELYLRIVEEMYEPEAVEARLADPDDSDEHAEASRAESRSDRQVDDLHKEVIQRINALAHDLSALAAAMAIVTANERSDDDAERVPSAAP